jgi:hypothetical protein
MGLPKCLKRIFNIIDKRRRRRSGRIMSLPKEGEKRRRKENPDKNLSPIAQCQSFPLPSPLPPSYILLSAALVPITEEEVKSIVVSVKRL